MKKNYNGIDLIKFIMAIFVVAIHLTPFAMFGDKADFISLVVTRVAVPFFFCSSGYLLRLKLDKNKNHYKDKVLSFSKRILWLYFIWTTIYIPWIIFWFINNHKTISSFLQECIFDGSYIHLWYLPALVVASLLVSVLYKKIKVKIIILIALVIYIIGLFDTCWYNLVTNDLMKSIISNYDKIFITTRNGVFFGFIFVALGFFAVEHNIKIKTSLIGSSISIICLFAEMSIYDTYHLSRTSEGAIFSVPLTYFVFHFAKNLELKNRSVYYDLRHMGVLIYLGHCWIDFTFSIWQYNILHTTSNSMIRFGYTLIVMTAIAKLVVVLQKKSKFKWLKKIY